MMSARLPTSSEPTSASNPSARAEPMVAMRSTSRHGSTVASPVASFWSSAAWRISSNMSRLLFVMTESVPRPTVAPAARRSRIRATPLPSFMFEVGQWATPIPLAATSSTSVSVSWMQCAHATSGPSPISRSRYSAGVSPPVRSATMATSSRLSARWVWIPTPKRSACSRIARYVDSSQEYRECGPNHVRIRSGTRSCHSSTNARLVSSDSPTPTGSSMTCGLNVARRPLRSATAAASPGNRKMSTNDVVPFRIISSWLSSAAACMCRGS